MDESDNEEQNENLTKKLREWYKQFEPAKKCTNDLLQILNAEGFNIPNSVNNLTSTAKRRYETVNASTDEDSDTDDEGFDVPVKKQRKVVEPANALDSDTNDNSSMHGDEFLNDTIDNDSWPSAERMSGNAVVKTDICKEINANVMTGLQEKQKYLRAQTNYLMREVAILNVKLADKKTVENVIEKSSQMFPIGNIGDLVELEKLLNDNDAEIQISNMKIVIRNEPMNKSLTRILSQNIILEHNYEGKQGKLPLNAYPKFMNVLCKVYGGFESFSEFVFEFKHALACIKKKIYKAKCMNRKLVTTAAPDPLEIDAKGIKTFKSSTYDDYYD